MELRHLRYFVAVAEELNVRQAAIPLHLSQPPLTRQIHDLEDEVGTKLFVRSQSGMRLTEAGRTFLKEARLILAQSQRAVQLAQAKLRSIKCCRRLRSSVAALEVAILRARSSNSWSRYRWMVRPLAERVQKARNLQARQVPLAVMYSQLKRWGCKRRARIV
jgi:DNA-binding transcriptional LysR family regulator